MTNDPVDALSLYLLAAEPLTWQPEAVAQRLNERGEPAEVVVSDDPAQMLIVRRAENEVIVFGATSLDGTSTQLALRQTWDWEASDEVLGRCACSQLVADRRAKRLPHAQRLRSFQGIVAALMETSTPGRRQAVHSLLCQRMIEPEAFLQGQQPGGDVLCGMVNVRLYAVADHGPDAHLMDTLGLAALGLPDLQCVYRGLDPDDVGALLWDYAYYLFEKGDVIEDGHVVKGLQAEEHWTCGRQESLTEPRRIVLDLYPGPEHDPGEREDD